MSKSSAEDVFTILDQIRAHVSTRKSAAPDLEAAGSTMDVDSEAIPDDVAREAFLQCLLQIGHKSFSHSLTAIER